MVGKAPQTRQQMRAQAAYSCISSAKKTMSKKETDDYAQLAKKFPALVHNCGLAQAIAFIQAKEEATGKAYIAHLNRIMDEKSDIENTSRNADQVKYQWLTREIIMSATWLKRYSEALLEQD